MSSAIITRREYNPLFTPQPAGFLIGNVNDVIQLELDVEVEISSLSSYANTFTITNISPTEVRVQRVSGSFLSDGFNNGASITIDETNNGSPETLTGTISMVNNTLMIITPATGTLTDGVYPNTSTTTNLAAKISANTTINGIDFNYNLIKNSQLSAAPFGSLIDNATTGFTANGIDATVLTYSDLTPVGLQSGMSIFSAKIKGGGIVSSVQKFTLQLIYLITSVCDNVDNFSNNTTPSPYFNGESVTDIFKIKMLPQFNNPNVSVSTDSSSNALLGNVGWFGENFNGQANNYSLNNVELLDSLGLAVSGILTDGETSFTMSVNQPGNTNTSKYKFGFMWVPSTTSLYTSNSLPNYKNFLYNGLDDAAAFDWASVPGSYTGQTNGSGAQMDIEVTSMSGSADLVTIQGKFKPNAAFKTYIEALPVQDRKYIVWLSLADETLSTTNSDRVSLLMQFSEFKVVETDFEAYTIQNTFLNHAQPNAQQGVAIYEGASEDEVTANSLMSVDTANGDIIEEIKFLVEGYNLSTGQTYNLETRTYNTAGFPILSGVQQIAINDLRGFLMASGVEKNEIIVERNVTADVGTKKGYRLFYPFRLRWEDWIKNLNVPGDFYNVSELNNGLNNNWAGKDFFGDWRIYYAVQLRVNRGGKIINTKNRFQLLQRTYDESAIYNAAITHFDNNTLASLYTGLDANGVRTNAILPNGDTLFQCLFTLSDPFGDVGDITKFYAVVRIEEFQGAGETGIMMLSSILTNETSSNILKPLPGETGPLITKVSDTEILVECLVDYTKLNTSVFTYKTSATIRCKGIRLGKYDQHYSLKYD